MEKINFKKDKIPFTQVANAVLVDKKLSFKAKGIYAYLYSKPSGWDFAIDRIAKETSDGRKGVNSGLHELEVNGYLIREKQTSGRVFYLLKSQMPQMDIRDLKPDVPNGKVPKWQSAQMVTVSNKDKEVIKSISNKDSEETSQDKLVAEIINLFEGINPVCKRYYGNKTQRESCKSLLDLHGFKQVKAIIELLPKTNIIPFMPTITTPFQLDQKWASLEALLRKKQQELSGKKVNTIL